MNTGLTLVLQLQMYHSRQNGPFSGNWKSWVTSFLPKRDIYYCRMFNSKLKTKKISNIFKHKIKTYPNIIVVKQSKWSKRDKQMIIMKLHLVYCLGISVIFISQLYYNVIIKNSHRNEIVVWQCILHVIGNVRVNGKSVNVIKCLLLLSDIFFRYSSDFPVSRYLVHLRYMWNAHFTHFV